MKYWKKTLPFLLINILVSVAAMLTVLWFWQQRNPKPESEPLPTRVAASQVSTQTDLPAATPEADAAVKPALLSIEGVFGAGDLNVEYILIRNLSDSGVNLNGWSVSSGSGLSFTLPYLNLNKNGAVRLYSKHGTNTVIELYWNSDTALWSSGDEIFLIDGSGKQAASWQVP